MQHLVAWPFCCGEKSALTQGPGRVGTRVSPPSRRAHVQRQPPTRLASEPVVFVCPFSCSPLKQEGGSMAPGTFWPHPSPSTLLCRGLWRARLLPFGSCTKRCLVFVLSLLESKSLCVRLRNTRLASLALFSASCLPSTLQPSRAPGTRPYPPCPLSCPLHAEPTVTAQVIPVGLGTMVLHIMWFSAGGLGWAWGEDNQLRCKSLNSLPKSFPCPKQTEDAPEAERREGWMRCM